MDDADEEIDVFGRSAARQPDGVGGSSDQFKQQSDIGASAATSIGRPRVWDRNRSAEEYMDDRDYEDWGGPTGVSAEYSDQKKIAASVGDSSQQQSMGLLVPTELLQPMAGPTDAIGRLLLRKLGWREGSGDDKSSAYVPTHDGENTNDDTSSNSKACSHEALLSKKRLKKIQLSERCHVLPPAKIDSYGLGYDPFRNAPEFAAHREQRRKRAEERARAAGGGVGQGRYHVSDVLNDEDHGDDDGDRHAARDFTARKDSEKRGNNKSTVLAYETAEDFIGRTGTAGFALEDDDDDVYDNAHMASSAGFSAVGGGGSRSKLVGIGGEEYHTELIDHESDAEGDESSQVRHGGSAVFAGALNAWAAGDGANAAGDTSTATRAVTSDGRLPLDGFVLGGSGGEKDSTSKRYPGPDLPPNFEPSRHVFRKEDLPAQVAEQSRKTKREADEARGARSGGTASSQRFANPLTRDATGPMAGAAFAGLAAAMKNRFTAGAAESGNVEDKEHVGLRIPDSNSTISGDSSTTRAAQKEEKKEIQVKRSLMLWYPEPLLCKRLGVRPPSRSNTPASTYQKQTEETFFNKEVLGATGASASASALDPGVDGAIRAGETENNDVPIRPPQSEDNIGAARPPIEACTSCNSVRRTKAYHWAVVSTPPRLRGRGMGPRISRAPGLWASRAEADRSPPA